ARRAARKDESDLFRLLQKGQGFFHACYRLRRRGARQILLTTLLAPLIVSPGKAFTEPLFVIITISLISLAFGLRRARPRKPVALVMVLLVVLWILSTRIVAMALVRS